MSGDSITAAVLMHVRRACGRKKKPTVTRELTLGSSSVRADLAILGDEFIGVEVKGARDTLRRLPAQMEGYAAHFDRTILVVDNRHLKRISQDSLCGAAVWSFDIEGKLSEVRAGSSSHTIGVNSYLEMMTQEERRKLLALGCNSEGAEVTPQSARSAFFSAFRARYSKKSAQFWAATARRNILASDILMLSRFLDSRNEARRLIADRNEFWQRWADQHSKHEP